jgi:ABC-type branched-subunit amino acid transport system substrate-binding protein
MSHVTRRVFALTALVAALTGPAAFAQGQGTIKIGLLTIDSGPFATYTELIKQAATTGVEMLNAEGGALGRKFELVIQAHSGTPAAAVAAATKLAQQGGVTVIMGQTLSSHSLALVPKLDSLNVLQIDTYAQSNDLMTKSCAPNYFRANTPDSVVTAAMKQYVAQSGAKTWNLISPDYAAGHSFTKQFTEMVQAMGGTVQQALFAPTGTTDFGSYISQLSKPADGLVVTLYMSDGNSFAKQQKQFGLFDKYKTVIGNGFATDFQLEAQGDSVLNVVNNLSYHYTIPGARNAEYVKFFEQRVKRKPIYTDADIMLAMEVFRAAVIKAKSSEVPAVRKALEGLKANTIFGEVEMRAADHTLIRPAGMAKVVMAPDGKSTTFTMRTLLPGNELYPPPSPECKVQ